MLPNFFVKQGQPVVQSACPTRKGTILRVYPFDGRNIMVKWRDGSIKSYERRDLALESR